MVTLWKSGKESESKDSAVAGVCARVGVQSGGICKDTDCDRFNLKLFFLVTQREKKQALFMLSIFWWFYLFFFVYPEREICSVKHVSNPYLLTDSWDCCSAISFCSSFSLVSFRPMGQSSGTVNRARVSLLSSSFRAEAYTFSAIRRTLSSTSCIDTFGKRRGKSEKYWEHFFSNYLYFSYR